MSTATSDLTTLAHAWDRAMVDNDADAIGSYMADDWTIVGADGKVMTKAFFLDLVRSGALTHNVMESDDFHIRDYNDTAVVVTKGVSGGEYRGHPFREVERVTCVFVKTDGQWRCVHTHLSRLAQ